MVQGRVLSGLLPEIAGIFIFLFNYYFLLKPFHHFSNIRVVLYFMYLKKKTNVSKKKIIKNQEGLIDG